MGLSASQQRSLEKCRRLRDTRTRHAKLASKALDEMRAEWATLAASGVRSHVIAEASGVSAASVRMAWGDSEQTA